MCRRTTFTPPHYAAHAAQRGLFLLRRVQRMDAERMLQGLRPRARELLWLAYVEKMTHREIAAVTGLNVLSIRILLQRARREAQVLLEPRGTDHA